jgi:ribosome-associated translation inhibitor RaiA
MKIIIQSLDFVAGEKLRYFLEEHIRTLPETTGKHITKAEIILGEESTDLSDKKFCAIRVVVPDKNYLVTEHAGNYEKAFIIALEGLKKQLNTSSSSQDVVDDKMFS